MSTRPLRIGIIGCGNVATSLHLPNWLAHPDVAQVVALADPAEATLEAARVMAGLTVDQVHSNALELIARTDVDAVDICTPQHLRRDILVASAKAGKHILCEKPLAAVPADAAAAVAAAAEMGTTLAMVHNYVWLPEIQAARRVIDSGEIGEVRSVIVNFLGVVDAPGAFGHRADWRHDPALAGGGVLIDMLHGVYIAELLLGAPLQRVSAYVDSSDTESYVEDIALCRFETTTNAALVNIGWGLGSGGIEISGTKGRISIRYQGGGTAPWAPLEHVFVSTAENSRIEVAVKDRNPSNFESFKHVALDFEEAVRTGRAPKASGTDGQRILEATIGAYESAVTGQIVSIPLDHTDPVFQHGVLGVRQLELPEWSPVRRGALFASETTN